MTDLAEVLRSLEQNATPDMWDEIEARARDGSRAPHHSMSHRWTAGLVGAAIGLAAIVLVAFAFHSPAGLDNMGNGAKGPAIPPAIPVVSEVPAIIPPGGVSVTGFVTLMPPDGFPTKTRKDAVTIVLKQFKKGTTGSVSAVLSTVTEPDTLQPPDTSIPFRQIDHRLAWVVTVELTPPVDVSGAPILGMSGEIVPVAPEFASKENVLLDAHTGEWLDGFFTGLSDPASSP